jgi:high affinity sulfate transporter 1
MSEVVEKVKDHFYGQYKHAKEEIVAECAIPTEDVKDLARHVVTNFRSYIHIPYFPAFHSPGWLVRYVCGPHTPELLEDMMYDIMAGVTVGLTLIPQALSYATLANLPPLCGLYTAILPSMMYAFVGSSLQLCVGPVALVSLLTGTLVAEHVPDFLTDTEAAIDTAAQAALSCGIILCVMSILNLGHLINFISHPVMSGFTTGAAMLIGLSQMKNAFGFSEKLPAAPQQGQVGYEYQHQVMSWFKHYFYDRFNTHTSDANFLTQGDQIGHLWINPYAIKICFGLYIPLMVIQIFKNSIPATAERKKQLWYRAFLVFNSLAPFFAIIIGAHIAWRLKESDHFHEKTVSHSWYKSQLKVIGQLTPGLHYIRVPKIRWPFAAFLGDCIPLTMIAYMESYSVARRIAAQRNELHILNASQEMWGNGVANLMAAGCTGYPVSGSFSRSSLNYATGARTPASKLMTVAIVALALGALTEAMYYIPNAALSAIIFLAISNLINFSDFWEAWRHSKKDFFVLCVTFTIVFALDSSTGLAVGLGASLFVLLCDIVMGKRNAPWVSVPRKENDGIDVVNLEADVYFLNAYRVKDFIAGLYIKPPTPTTDSSTRGEKAFFTITTTLDAVFRPHVLIGVEETPNAIAIDFSTVRQIDITGMKVIDETLSEGRTRGVRFVLFNIHPEIAAVLAKFGVKNDESTKEVNLDKYLALSTLPTKLFKYAAAIEASEPSASDAGKAEDVVVDVEGGEGVEGDLVKGIELTAVNDSAYKAVPAGEN